MSNTNDDTTETKTTSQNLEAALSAMNNKKNVFDVTIICTTDDHQAEYWMERLSKGIISKTATTSTSTSTSTGEKEEKEDKEESEETKKQKLIFPIVLAVSEDWNDSGGAGNGLGTLYAFQKANQLAKTKHEVNLEELLLEKKISAALYHTAGKGTRLAPLPASENNNKPGVKLPFCQEISGGYEPLTVLEAVVKQTSIYSSSRKGRLSVFWGDQVFIPSANFEYTPTHHIDILCTLLGDSAPTEEEWKSQGLEKYGVIAVIESKTNGDTDDAAAATATSEAAQVEKVSHATATEMLQKLGNIGAVGPSLGSFSISGPFLQVLCQEFSSELTAKTGKFDTDPHFWMPLTLSLQDYVTLMKQKGVEEDVSTKHFERIDKMKSKAKADHVLDGLGLFGAVNVGKDACWWDYGQLKLYSKNCVLLLSEGDESKLLNKFLGLSSSTKIVDSTISTEHVKMDDNDTSRIFSSKVQKGSIKNSMVSFCHANEMNVDGAIVVNCSAKTIQAGKGCILYNIITDAEEGIVAKDGEVMVHVMDEKGESTLLKSRMDVDGGKAWKQKLDYNDLSFEDVHKNNKNANIQEIDKKRKDRKEKVSASLGL